MLVRKLESGEYTPDVEVCIGDAWDRRIDKVLKETVTFYEGQGGERFEDKFGNRPVLGLVSTLDDLIPRPSGSKLRALDVGCGPGQYADLLEKRNFQVDLLDSSARMLRSASSRLGRALPPEPRSIYELVDCQEHNVYDLIFASAIMVHVPIQKTRDIYRAFFQLLKPRGVLFVNYKIGDHTLVAADGRFYAYYCDEVKPEVLLTSCGFTVEDRHVSTSCRDLNDKPTFTKWANLYCRKQ